MTKIEEILEIIKKENVKYVDIQFLDVPGYLQHVTVSANELDEKAFEEGLGKLDGSSIKGFKAIYESDMVLVPDPDTFAIVPFYKYKTVRFLANIYEAFGGGRFSKDPRYIAERAEDYLKKQGFDVSYWGPEVEFFIFDSVKIIPNPLSARDSWGGTGYVVESKEAIWNSSSNTYPIRFKEGYFPAPPVDTLQDIRSEACEILEKYFNIRVEAHHHEVATAGQGEIDIRFDSLKRTADNVVTLKFVVKNVAAKHGMLATFMPKPIFGDNASGMHTHVSLWKDGKNTFYDPSDEYAELSQIGRYFIGGLMEHAKSLSAIVSPTTNSYKRLVPGYEAPVYIAWSKRNRSAFIRVPVYFKGTEKAERTKRIEYRPVDPSCNPYYAFAAILAAGLDGIKKKIDPGDPIDENIYLMSPEKRRQLGIKELPGSLKEAIEELLSDNEYLKPIFPKELIETWIELKMDEYLENNKRPTPYEFYLYLDI